MDRPLALHQPYPLQLAQRLANREQYTSPGDGRHPRYKRVDGDISPVRLRFVMSRGEDNDKSDEDVRRQGHCDHLPDKIIGAYFLRGRWFLFRVLDAWWARVLRL